MLRLEQLESREVPAFIPVTPGYTATQTGAFLDPQHPSDVMRVTTYPGDGMGGRLTVSRDNGGSGPANEIVYDGFPFGDEARLGGQAVVIPGVPDTGTDKIAFAFPNAGAGPRVGILEPDGHGSLSLKASYFALPAEYRGGFTMQAVLKGNGTFEKELLVLAGASGGPVLAAMDPTSGTIRTQFFVGDPEDRSGGYEFQPQGSGVSSPVTDTWAVAIGHNRHEGDPPYYESVRLFSLATGEDISDELSVLL